MNLKLPTRAKLAIAYMCLLTGKPHDYHSESVVLVFGVVVFGFQPQAREDGGHQIGEQRDDAEGGGGPDIGCKK